MIAVHVAQQIVQLVMIVDELIVKMDVIFLILHLFMLKMIRTRTFYVLQVLSLQENQDSVDNKNKEVNI